MTIMIYLLPVALFLGLGGLTMFFWAMKSGQFDDLEGDSARILFDDREEEGNGLGPVSG